MPWVSALRYKQLLRQANRDLAGQGRSEFKNGINDIGYLLWRLTPEKTRENWGLWPHPFEHMDVYRCEEKVFIFVVQDEKALVFEDGADLFPSDELVAKLKLIMSCLKTT